MRLKFATEAAGLPNPGVFSKLNFVFIVVGQGLGLTFYTV